MPPRYFYDEVGSLLFEAICALPEYYLTRTETGILEAHAKDITGRLRQDCRLVELGAGSAVKTRILLAALQRLERPLSYVPIDISEGAMRIAEANVISAFPDVAFTGIVGDWFEGLGRTRARDHAQNLILFLGSSIGNLGPDEAVAFLSNVRAHLGREDRLLLGVDLVKPADLLVAAYDDPAGVTAAFNKNLLARVNRELGGRFDLDLFRHEARWDSERCRIEMHLVSQLDQAVAIEDLDLDVHFRAGESIHTESAHKYTDRSLGAIVTAAGLAIEATWTDPDVRFALHLLGGA